MGMLPSRNYESDHTRFIRELIAQKPDLPAKQKQGRLLLWDKPVAEVDRRRDMDLGRVPQKPYPYGSE